MENKMVLIMAIVNSGYVDVVMDIARSKGAKGGTIFNASGSVSANSEKLYGITINPEKEVAMILVSSEIVDELLGTLYDEVGSNSDAQGIAFAVPVEQATSNLMKQYTPVKKEN